MFIKPERKKRGAKKVRMPKVDFDLKAIKEIKKRKETGKKKEVKK